MSRLVTLPPRGLAAAEDVDDFRNRLERLAKYVPSEVLALYIFLNGIAANATTHNQRTIWFSIAFIFCLVATPSYFYFISTPRDALRWQQIVSTFAFIIWAYGLGAGIFVETGLYYPIGAGFLVAIFSFISALLKPSGSN